MLGMGRAFLFDLWPHHEALRHSFRTRVSRGEPASETVKGKAEGPEGKRLWLGLAVVRNLPRDQVSEQRQ